MNMNCEHDCGTRTTHRRIPGDHRHVGQPVAGVTTTDWQHPQGDQGHHETHDRVYTGTTREANVNGVEGCHLSVNGAGALGCMDPVDVSSKCRYGSYRRLHGQDQDDVHLDCTYVECRMYVCRMRLQKKSLKKSITGPPAECQKGWLPVSLFTGAD